MAVRALTDGPVTVTPSAWDVFEDGRFVGRVSVKDGAWFGWAVSRREWTQTDSRAAALEFVQASARASQPTLMGA